MTDLNTLKAVVIDALEDMKAKDIVVLDVKPLTSVADLMVVASGTSTRHVKSIADRVRERVKENGFMPLGVEGEEASEWVLDVKPLTSVADLMVVASGTSTRHVKSIADRVRERVKENGFMPLGVEGEEASEWVLVDLGDIIVHVMQPDTRRFYDLEKLWSMTPQDSAQG
jgi:ribosome-associated protein